MATLQDFEQRLRILGADFRFLHDGEHPAVLAQIEAYEQATGIRFPAEFVQFLTRFGNGVLEISPLVWPRSEGASGYGFCLFGLNNNPTTPDWLQYGQNFDEELCGQAFFERAGSLYNAYLRADGRIFTSYSRYDGWEDMEPYDGNLFDYLLDEIAILEEARREYAQAAAALDAALPDGVDDTETVLHAEAGETRVGVFRQPESQPEHIVPFAHRLAVAELDAEGWQRDFLAAFDNTGFRQPENYAADSWLSDDAGGEAALELPELPGEATVEPWPLDGNLELPETPEEIPVVVADDWPPSSDPR